MEHMAKKADFVPSQMNPTTLAETPAATSERTEFRSTHAIFKDMLAHVCSESHGIQDLQKNDFCTVLILVEETLVSKR
jgi:hypothetical protein